jgi:hypothetical protein
MAKHIKNKNDVFIKIKMADSSGSGGVHTCFVAAFLHDLHRWCASSVFQKKARFFRKVTQFREHPRVFAPLREIKKYGCIAWPPALPPAFGSSRGAQSRRGVGRAAMSLINISIAHALKRLGLNRTGESYVFIR